MQDNMSRILLTHHDLTVEVESSPNKELMDHMHRTVMGQPGGLQYQHTNLADRLNSPGENYYMYLRKGSKMLGSVGFCGKPTVTFGVSHDSWLIRYFSIKAPMRAVPKSRKEKADLKDENRRSSVLGRFIQPIFADPSQLREINPSEDTPAIIYAIIEQNNLRSMNFSFQMGLETVGEIAGFTFSRFRPKKSSRVRAILKEEEQPMLGLINDFYRDYTLFFSGPLFKDNGYYIIKEGDKILAGIQVYPVTWRVVDFGSKMANVGVRVLSRIPWLNKRINSDQIDFLAFDGIYYEQGCEPALYELMEAVLKKHNRYLAMLMIDKGSSLYKDIWSIQKLGPLHKIFGSFTADIRVRFLNLPDEVRQFFLDHPTYIPTYDNS